MISQITPLGLRPARRGDIDRGFGVAGADEDAAGPGDQREDMAGRDDRFGAVGGVDGDGDGARAVGGADAGGDSLAGLDRDGEGGLHAAAVGAGHRLEAELVGALLGQREADQAAAVAGHEVDRVGRRHLRRDDQVALILAILVVDEDEHPPVARLVDDLFGPDQHLGGAALDQLFQPAESVGGRVPVGLAEFAQAVGMKAGSAGEPGAADLAGVDDGVQPLDQGRAHECAYITL